MADEDRTLFKQTRCNARDLAKTVQDIVDTEGTEIVPVNGANYFFFSKLADNDDFLVLYAVNDPVAQLEGD